jgi:lysophospholipid acyltransferase (LPLAT)-like uncharacterized protein
MQDATAPSTLSRFLGHWLGRYASFVSQTARYVTVGFESVALGSAEAPGILAAWHGLTMMVTGFVRTRVDPTHFVLLVPDDPRGIVLDAWARSWGAETFAVSMHAESLVAARRLLTLIRSMRSSGNPGGASAGGACARILYVNPDGPYGPSHVPKDGVLFIARKADAPITPVGAFTATAVHVPRWDRYTIPLPFSRIAVAFGEPLVVPASGSLDAARSELAERLSHAEQRAEELYRAGKR